MNLFSRTTPSSAPILEEAQARFGKAPSTPLSAILQFLLKRSAKHLKTHLATKHGIALSHGQSLDAISASLGFADWNTANAVTARISAVGPDTDAEPAPSPAPSGIAAQRLSSSIDFSANSIVVGPSGCGKSVALMFATQRARALEQGRPVVIVRGPESPRYQPNWGQLLSLFENVETLVSVSPTRPVSGQDKLEVVMREDNWTLDAHQRQAHHASVVSSMLEWIRRRAHLRPLILVEEAYGVLGKEYERLMREAPDEATFIWTTQLLQDLGAFEQVAARFRTIHVMRGSERHLPEDLSRLICEDVPQVRVAIKQLELGEAVQLSIRAEPLLA